MIRLLAVAALSAGGYSAAQGRWLLAALDLVAAAVLITLLWISPDSRRWRALNGRWPNRSEREQLKRRGTE